MKPGIIAVSYGRYFFIIALLLVLFGCSSTSYRQNNPIKQNYSRFITVNGLKIHYYDTGPENYRQTLLLLHGWMGSSYDFYDILPLLSSSYRVIVPDIPGCGLSSKKPFDFTVESYVAFIKDFADALGLHRFSLIAHSMGGHLAVRFTERYEQYVSSLVLIAPDGLKGEEGVWLFFAKLGPLVDLGLFLNTRLFISMGLRSNVFYDKSKLTDDIINAVSISALGRDSARTQAKITRNIIGKDPLDAELKLLRLPVLLLWGKEDRVLNSKWAYKYKALIASSKLVVLEKCGHMPMTEKPAETAGIIRNFLTQQANVNTK